MSSTDATIDGPIGDYLSQDRASIELPAETLAEAHRRLCEDFPRISAQVAPILLRLIEAYREAAPVFERIGRSLHSLEAAIDISENKRRSQEELPEELRERALALRQRRSSGPAAPADWRQRRS